MKKTLVIIFSIFIILLMILRLISNQKEKYISIGDFSSNGLCDCCKCGLITCEECKKNSVKCCDGNLYGVDRLSF